MPPCRHAGHAGLLGLLLYPLPLLRLLPFFLSVREYTKRVKLPADLPLTVHAFDASGAWEPATDAHIRSHLKMCYPGLDEDSSQKAKYALALRYARQCTSVVARISTAKAIIAFVERAKAGRLAPVDQVA